MPNKKACCNASYRFYDRWYDVPLCEKCANEEFTQIRVTLYLCLVRILKRDVTRLICTHYVNNPFVMNPVSRFLHQTDNHFLFIRGKGKFLWRAINATPLRVSFYEDSKWTDVIIISNAHNFPRKAFFNFVSAVRNTGRKAIIWGKEQKGLLDIIPLILTNAQIL
jgi:hypothetical protein